MDSQKTRRPVPNIKFRVLIIGRANAGKTSILQRVCETTDSPEIYRINKTTRERIRLDPSSERGQHDIKDEVVFTKHKGYIFHDSRGFECGGNDELKVVQDFVRDRSRAKRLSDRLHAIWYCIPMDNQRPTLDLKYYHGICPDRNVPVIAVFTKYDQFKRNVRMGLEDKGDIDAISNAVSEAERLFQADYRSPLGESTTFVRLEEMHQVGRDCTDLIVTTADALNDEAVRLMLLTVQRENVELSIRTAVKRVDFCFGKETVDTEGVVRQCFKYFPYLWAS